MATPETKSCILFGKLAVIIKVRMKRNQLRNWETFDYGGKARVKTPQIYMKQYGWDETRSSWYSFMHSVHMRTHGIQVDRILNDGVSTICDPD